MENKSIWEREKYPFHFSSSYNNELLDVLIIGGGMAGIHTAYFLKDSNLKITLIDKGHLASGVTAKTTGKITYLQDLVYQQIEKLYGKEKSYLYYQSQKKAISLLLSIIKSHHISCDLEKVPSYTFSNEKNRKKDFEREKALLKDFGNIDTEQTLPLPLPYLYSISAPDTYVFHPLKYLYALISKIQKQVSIYENVTAHCIEKEKDFYLVYTDKGIFRTKRLVVSSHYPFFMIPGWIPLKTHIENAYALASSSSNQKFNAISYKKNIQSFRFHKNFLIYAGASHSFAKSYDIEKEKETFLQSYHLFSPNKIQYLWDTHDIVTDDFLPFIGSVKEDIYIATGFNKWGMTNGVLAANLITDSILGRENEFQSLFSPSRSYTILRGFSFACNLYRTTKTYICTKLDRYKHNTGRANIQKEDGIWYGVYQDEKGVEHKVLSTCPHMGCTLTFNHMDVTWDCPCHGSRFSIDGDIVEGPSTYSIRVKKNTK